MWRRENRIFPSSGIEEQHNEQPDRMTRKEVYIRLLFSFVCAAAIVPAIFGGTYGWHLKFDAPYRHVRFSVISVSISGFDLNSTISPPPVFHVIMRAEQASENDKKTCLNGMYASVSYNGITSEKDLDYVGLPCYNMEKWSEFVIPVQMPGIYRSRNLRQRIWDERENAMLALEMKFIAEFCPSNTYHVACKNVTLGASDMLIPCNATKKIKFTL